MILILAISVVAAALAYVMASRLQFGYRAIIAGVIFIALNAPNIMVLIVGDQPPKDARVVTKEELKNAANPNR